MFVSFSLSFNLSQSLVATLPLFLSRTFTSPCSPSLLPANTLLSVSLSLSLCLCLSFSLSLSHTLTRAHTQTHTCAHKHTHLQRHTLTNKHAHHAHAHTHTSYTMSRFIGTLYIVFHSFHTLFPLTLSPLPPSITHTHTHAHTHTHTNTQTNKHTHTHKQTLASFCLFYYA